MKEYHYKADDHNGQTSKIVKRIIIKEMSKSPKQIALEAERNAKLTKGYMFNQHMELVKKGKRKDYGSKVRPPWWK